MDRSSFGELLYESELLAKAATWPELTAVDDLTPEAVRAIADAQGTDFATALIYDRVRRRPLHGLSIESSMDNPWIRLRERSVKIVIVPGAFHLESPRTGADGRLVRNEAQQHGVEVALVPSESFGSLATNAEILCKWLRQHRGQELVLVSLSKGGAEVKTALHQGKETEFEWVSAWINLSGITEGSALVDWLLARKLRSCGVRMLFHFRGYDFKVLQELRYEPQTGTSDRLRVPAHLQTVHVVGFPLAHHLSSSLARRGHRRISNLGPNDGAGILLAEAARRPGIVYPVWGADHYLRPAGQDMRTIVRSVLNLVNTLHAQADTHRRDPLATIALQ